MIEIRNKICDKILSTRVSVLQADNANENSGHTQVGAQEDMMAGEPSQGMIKRSFSMIIFSIVQRPHKYESL